MWRRKVTLSCNVALSTRLKSTRGSTKQIRKTNSILGILLKERPSSKQLVVCVCVCIYILHWIAQSVQLQIRSWGDPFYSLTCKVGCTSLEMQEVRSKSVKIKLLKYAWLLSGDCATAHKAVVNPRVIANITNLTTLIRWNVQYYD